jgi:arylsulfatase
VQTLALVLFAASLPAAEPLKKPSIIIVLADDAGYGDIGPFGQKIIHTPALDKLASSGMKFTQHYAGSPVCAPSRCVLITGRHPGHAFVRDNKDKAFFLYCPTTVPHLALQVPGDSLDECKGKLDNKPYPGGNGCLPQQYPHAACAAMITRMDSDISRLVQLVKNLGLEENTIFIFTSDNGAVFPLSGFDPIYFNSNGKLRGYKEGVYEGGIREPLIVSWKGHIPAGTTSTFLSGFEDWFPTLLELAGATSAAPTTALYNLATDPSEKENVAAAHPDIVAKLEKLAAEQRTPSKEFPFPLLDQTTAK